jgi:tyrosine-protein phosphatase YwqE
MHCHLLPRVDDGSKSEEETATCMRVMRAAGFDKIFCTPHYQFPRFPNVEEDILERFDNLKIDLATNGVKKDEVPELTGIAGEYRIDSGFQQRIEDNKFLLIGGKYLLVELSLHQQVMGVEQVLFDLQMKGYDMILAHPERYPYYSSSSHVLEHFKDMGILFQINILSLGGFYGEGPRRKAFEMLENGWIDLMGTDMHNMLYAQALIDCTHDKKIEKVLSTHTFLNKSITDPTAKQKTL